MPLLTHMRQHSHGAVLPVPPRAWEGAQHARRNAHCVPSLDNLSCQPAPIAPVTLQACLADGGRGALGMGVLTSGAHHP
jgi:hypothetical protein